MCRVTPLSQSVAGFDNLSSSERRVRLKALTLKQNMEILCLLEAFNDEDSDNESVLDENNNSK